MSKAVVLVADDEEAVCGLIALYLENEGFQPVVAYDGDEALVRFKDHQPALLILDIMMPKKNGWEVCREIRRQASRVPVILLTAKGQEIDRIFGFELGADDYVTKPFSPRELMMRVKAVLRRATGQPASESQRLEFSGLVIDRSAYDVLLLGRKVEMAPKEFELLWFLASHKGQVLTREQLLSEVWGYEYTGDARTIDVHIKRLREKLQATDHPYHYIRTVRSVGYKFEVVER